MAIVNRIATDAQIEALMSTINTAYSEATIEPDGELDVANSLVQVINIGNKTFTMAMLGQTATVSEFTGTRNPANMSSSGWLVEPKPYESSISTSLLDLDDDLFINVGTVARELAAAVKNFQKEQIIDCIKNGDTTLCYDGQNFFDTDHPGMAADGVTPATYSNKITGSATSPFILAKTGSSLKPWARIVREEFYNDFTDVDKWNKKSLSWGAFGRQTVVGTLWQYAIKSYNAVTATNVQAAYDQIVAIRGEKGRLLNNVPDTLIVDQTNEAAAVKLIGRQLVDGGDNNIYYNKFKLVVLRGI